MTSSRFFVTNLPTDTTENELCQLFKEYGTVTLVDLKTKENALEPGQVNVFAFVTLEISGEDAEYYLNELKWKKLRGVNIKVSLAKESFLERLKRERIENEAGENKKSETNLVEEETRNKSEIYSQNLQNTRRIFNEDEDFSSDISGDLLITKKRAARSMQNGKIVIHEHGAGPLHVIESQKKIKYSSTSKKPTAAEQKRKESLNKMKNQYEQKKSAIKEALSGSNNVMSNKIKFSDSEDEISHSETVNKTNIFGLDGEDEENINELKLNYGKKGDKLAKLKSQNQSLDSRFKIDEKFVDDDEAVDASKDIEKNAESEDDERKWQLNILEQVVGYKLDTKSSAEKAAKNKKMLRYDPSKTDHQKLLRQKENKTVESTENLLGEKDEQKTTTVSQDVFYVVSDTLTQSLKTRGEGFSLLNMFGTNAVSAELEQRDDYLKQLKDERILINKFNKNTTSTINYESSSSGEDDDDNKNINEMQKGDANSKMEKLKGNTTKVPVIMETFFFNKNDERLKEGAQFFRYDKLDKIAEEDYEPVRRQLNKLIKKKILKTKKNLIVPGHKGKRNKKKI